MIDIPQINSMVPVSDLMQLNDALRKAANVGYQTPAGMSSGSVSPLVPQSIEGTLASATYTMKELVLWPALAKRNVGQTVHEFTRIEDHGLDLDPFIAEGGGGITNKSVYSREFVKVKYLAERREVSDVAAMVNPIIGPSPNVLAEETTRGTLRLLQKLERALFYADSSLNDQQFDGLFKQLQTGTPGNFFDLKGEGLTVDFLQEKLGETYGAPNFGRVDTIYVEPRVHQDLIRQTVSYGRHDQLQVSDASSLTFGTRNLSIMAPYGPVSIKAAPFLHKAHAVPSAGSGTSDAPAAPTLNSAAHNGGNSDTSAWAASDVGDYIWSVVAVNDKGFSAPAASNQLGVSAGQKIEFSINDHAVTTKADPDPANAVKYYRIYRSDKNGAANTGKLIKEIPVNADGATFAGNAGTLVADLNGDVQSTSNVLALSHDPGVCEVVRLLDFMRRPLAEVATTKPFLLMLFLSPILKVSSKTFGIKNVGIG